MGEATPCWCDSRDLKSFSPDYWKCADCGSLVVKTFPEKDVSIVSDDDSDFYGHNYWFKHQEQDLHLVNIHDRARSDLHGRCLHWLQTLLKYTRPPMNVLEVGCSHGGFLALMKWAGFNVAGVELSQTIVELAEKLFHVPVMKG
ncbi:MAG: class I SAM-dependent methyltransferase, partial [Planctomycetales bacterium]